MCVVNICLTSHTSPWSVGTQTLEKRHRPRRVVCGDTDHGDEMGRSIHSFALLERLINNQGV